MRTGSSSSSSSSPGAPFASAMEMPMQMKKRMPRLAAWVTAAVLFPATAWTCPLCDTGTGQQVRAGIFGENFWTTLFAVIAPFPVLVLILLAMHFGLPRFGKRPVVSHPINTQEKSV